MHWIPINEAAVRDMIDTLPLRYAYQRAQVYTLMVYLLHQAVLKPQRHNGIELQRGDVFCSIRRLGKACYLSYQQARTILDHLLANAVITLSPTHRNTVITIHDFDTYVPLLDAHQRSDSALANTSLTQHAREHCTRVKEYYSHGSNCIRADNVQSENIKQQPSVRDQLKELCTQYPQITDILQTRWLPNAVLPASSDTPSAKLSIADTIAKLHTIDGYSWQDVGRIVEYAAIEWAPRYIGSPAKLRKATRAGDRKVHEAIWAQLSSSGLPALSARQAGGRQGNGTAKDGPPEPRNAKDIP